MVQPPGCMMQTGFAFVLIIGASLRIYFDDYDRFTERPKEKPGA